MNELDCIMRRGGGIGSRVLDLEDIESISRDPRQDKETFMEGVYQIIFIFVYCLRSSVCFVSD
jgi:hypothetical protein